MLEIPTQVYVFEGHALGFYLTRFSVQFDNFEVCGSSRADVSQEAANNLIFPQNAAADVGLVLRDNENENENSKYRYVFKLLIAYISCIFS